MTLINYTDFVPTPAPLTSGTTIQPYTDPTGEVWVAKNGVNGGNWFKARDVLRAQITRNAAYTTTANTNVIMPYDLVVQDTYGLATLGAAAAFNIPVAGWYRIQGQIHLQGSASGVSRNVLALLGAPGLGTRPLWDLQSPASTYTNANGSCEALLAVGNTIQFQYLTQLAQLIWTGVQDNYATISYLGTG
jgi:hypothetical protein